MRSGRASRRRVLITGGTGFIGTYVAALLLARGDEVCLFDRRDLDAEARFVLGRHAASADVALGSVDEWASLVDVMERQRPTAIVHIAAIVDPAFLADHPLAGFAVNVGGTINVLEAARIFGVERLVYFSSIGVYPRLRYEPVDTAHPIILPDDGPGTGAYGAAKVAGEAHCFAYRRAYGLDFRVLRPSAVYGFGMRLPMYVKPIVERAVRGEETVIEAGGRFPRDYTHVADVAALAVAALDAPDGADRVFNAATGEALRTPADIAEIVREQIPGARIRVGDELTEHEREDLRFRGRLSIETACAQLGWTPAHRRLEDGIADYIARYRAYLAHGGADAGAL